MNITTVTVSYGQTQSLPEYSNVKPQISLTAELEPGETADAIAAQLWEAARAAVHEQIDAALEANDRPAKYSAAPRYQVLKSHNDRFRSREAPLVPALVAILPDDKELAGDPRMVYSSRFHSSRNLRLHHAWRVAEAIARADGAPIIDCTDGNLDALEAALRPQPPTPEAAPAATELPF